MFDSTKTELKLERRFQLVIKKANKILRNYFIRNVIINEFNHRIRPYLTDKKLFLVVDPP